MQKTQVSGNLVELQCLMKFISMGFECSVPYGNQAKYDILVDIGNEILRIQCKKSRWIDDRNSIMFSTVSQTTNTQKTTRHSYTGNDIDYFATCWEENVYLVPVNECSTAKSLRIAPPTEKTPASVNLAEDYLVENFLSQFALYKESDFEEQVPIKIKDNGMATHKCKTCGAPVYRKDTNCVPCAHLASRTVERPSREELKALIRSTSFVEIGRRFTVTDNAVRRWCTAYNLPTKKTEIKKITEKEWIEI